MKARIALCACAAALLFGPPEVSAAPAFRTAPEVPVVLVASERALEAVGEAVVLVVPLGNGAHFGFVLNEPTETPLAQLFPEEEASKAVKAPVHMGGPALQPGVFAVVRKATPELQQLHRITPELSIALNTSDVDSVIARHPADARFFVGMMLWMPGQLAGEMAAGAWQVSAADPDVVMTRKPASLWSRLSERGQHRVASFSSQPGTRAPSVPLLHH